MPVYEGKDPYIFISYAHKDSDKVEPIVEMLGDCGLHFWWDKDIPKGSVWIETIASRLLSCKAVLMFMSQNFLESPDCNQEIRLAIERKIRIYPCYLDSVTPSPGIHLYVAGTQAVIAVDKSPKQSAEEILSIESFQNCIAADALPEEKKGVVHAYWDKHIKAEKDDWGPERGAIRFLEGSDFVCINSAADNPQIGDERSFIRVREAGSDQAFALSTEVRAGKRYEFCIYYHNDAKYELNKTGAAMANGFRLNAAFPQNLRAGKRAAITAKLKAANAKPQQVWAKAYLTTKDPIGLDLKYVPGSARLHNNGFAADGQVLADSLFREEGVYLGVNKLIGNMPGGIEYAGYVTFELETMQLGCRIKKTVSIDGKDFAEKVAASVGSELTFRTVFENCGSMDLTNVTFHDILPDSLELIPGSTVLVNHANPNGIRLGDFIDKNGFRTGLYGPGAFAMITYRASVKANAARMSERRQPVLHKVTAYAAHDAGEVNDSAAFIVI